MTGHDHVVDSAAQLELERFRRRCGAPAVGAAVVTEGWVSVAVAGTRRRTDRRPVETADRWHIGSCAKAVTAVQFARAVERGLTGWDATLPELVTDLGPAMAPGWRAVTAAQLLTHRAGLPGNLTRSEMEAAYQDDRPLAEQRTVVAARVLAQPPQEIGAFQYSKVGYVLAGAAIERLSGCPWETGVIADICEPLGMATAGFGAPLGDQPWGHRPRVTWTSGRGPHWIAWGRGNPVDPGSPQRSNIRADNPPVMGPAGRLHVSLHDWAQFMQLFVTAGGSIIGADSLTRITTPASGPGPRQSMGWAIPAGTATQRIWIGQQGSNTSWTATALVAATRDRAALVVCNDGRRRLLTATARLAATLLDTP